MKAIIVAACLVGLTMAGRASDQAGGTEVLTNESIISMTAAKVGRDLLMTKITTTRNTFDVTVSGLVSLTQGKVNQDVMKSMISAAGNPKLGPPASKTPEVLDNQAVVAMVTGKVPKAVILVKIQTTKATFDTTSSGLVNLTQAKVPSDIIQAMVVKGGGI